MLKYILDTDGENARKEGERFFRNNPSLQRSDDKEACSKHKCLVLNIHISCKGENEEEEEEE